MRLYQCDVSGLPLYFDNHFSVGANNAPVGFAADTLTLHTLTNAGDRTYTIACRPGEVFRLCSNAAIDGSNWLVAADDTNFLGIPARYNRVIPNTNTPQGFERFHKIGAAQRHLFYSILRFGIPCPDRKADPKRGLVFDFLDDAVDSVGNLVPAMTGHEDGLINLRAAEADDVVRETVRVSMGEPYRTLLEHFRHEIGHFFFDQLLLESDMLEEARHLFGDEREDYDAALRKNYEEGAPADWQQRFISTYASCHPAEDFAECWAHFFHIIDTLESARSFGLSIEPFRHRDLDAEVSFDPYRADSAQKLVDAWIPISLALNTFQRSMGQNDIYPFVMPPAVVEKLDFINRVIEAAREGTLGKSVASLGQPANIQSAAV
ncbi:putative zinc-binding metallopeptidase [Rhizobium sp. B230/85]|uniref:zinc-binding metallopeptidase family protein n=1 Tax=unclassified Rhizobium TaxID=2613769 RepID=UPI001ADCCAFD|nr:MULTISPECIES: putative zinc-binding metallopeptidase [unclassified Rhizobium]MBO9136886.1 putative zinc-binding metallopeptidase [Rhizobium sp. B209b/85]QXZ98597.1 putative zinc-binding metallopeptidase [Rhizobium sp. B230/85]